MLIDTHCHLDAPEFNEDRDAVITAARQAGLGAIVVPAVFRRNWDTVQALAEREPDVWFALGLHPLYVNDAGPDDLEHLRQRVMAVRDHPRFVGIGEIGLDYFVPGLDPARQQAVFEAQVRLAAEFGLPVILHTHAFNGSPQQAQHLIGLGMAIGFGGAMTFDRARNIRRLAASLPAESLVLETDAPDISPAWVHPGRNQPAELARIAQVLAELRGLSLQAVDELTTLNARRVLPALRLPGAGAPANIGSD